MGKNFADPALLAGFIEEIKNKGATIFEELGQTFVVAVSVLAVQQENSQPDKLYFDTGYSTGSKQNTFTEMTTIIDNSKLIVVNQ
ncbi:unnamed protein product, partial [Mesorhabditis spiculigera]